MKLLLKKAFFVVLLTAGNALCFSQSLPSLTTYINAPKKSDLITISKEQLENFSSAQEVLESKGFSYKNSNDEITFHGYWNSSIKVYIDDVLMNSPDTGKFKWEQINLDIVDSISIDTNSTNGCVSIYFWTNSKDWTKTKWNVEAASKFYKDSPFDSSKISAGFSLPILMDSGSSMIFKEAFAANYNQNHYGIRGNSESYTPDINESYSNYKKHYKGYEDFFIQNSFSTEFSSFRFPGATFGLSNLISFDDANCGKTGGVYFVEENQKDLIISTSFPILIPNNNFKIKILPSYMYSDLNYKKEAAFSNLTDEYKIHKTALDLNINFYKIFFLSSNVYFDYSIQKDSQKNSTINNNLLTAFINPEIKFSKNYFNFEFALPVNYFEPSNSIEFLYKAKFNYSNNNFIAGISATRNCTNPVFQQLYYAGAGGIGNPDLKNEIAYNFELPLSYNGFFEFSTKPYLIFYKDKIAWKSKNEIWTTENIGSSTNYGADIIFSTKKLIPHFTLSGNYTFCRAFLTTNKMVYGNQIMLTPIHSLSVNADFNFFDFKWNNKFFYESKKWTSNENDNSLCPKYNLTSSLSWTKNIWTIKGIWENILDFAYIDYGNIPQSGTSFSLIISVKN